MIFFPPILSSSDSENTDCCAVGFKKYFNDSILCNSVCVCGGGGGGYKYPHYLLAQEIFVRTYFCSWGGEVIVPIYKVGSTLSVRLKRR